MKTWLPGGVALLQLVVLLVMAGEREWIYHTGETVLLRTAPIDPMSPMRGEYVRLDYEISSVPRRLCRDGVEEWFSEAGRHASAKDRIVYAMLEVGDDGLAGLTGLTNIRPSSGVFLRGRVSWIDEHAIRVRYGTEAFFMNQGKARALEDALRGERRGVALNMEAAVSRGGTAVLRDYLWEPVGITLTLERAAGAAPPDGAGGRDRRLQTVVVELRNHGEAPVAIVDRPDGASFRLVRDERIGVGSYRWVGEEVPPPAARPEDVRLLQSGESHRARLDLELPRWFVVAESEQDPRPVSMATLTQTWNVSFRVEYTPPEAAELAGLPHAGLIFRRPLRSAAFTPGGAID